jgi:hypothetical protein
MDKRPETRLAAEILVRVWGMDSEGRPFFQNAKAGNISTDGALLSGIAHPLKPGDVIGVQHGERKARFRVVWVIDAGGFHKIDCGVKILHGQQSPWQGLAQANQIPDATGKNRRRFTRHKVLFPIEITFDDGRRSHQQTHATDIGGRGCYVETLMPLPIGTSVNLMFWIDAERIRTAGTVRTSDPGVGMGIEFTTLDGHVQEQLQHFLQKLDTGFANREAAKQGG